VILKCTGDDAKIAYLIFNSDSVPKMPPAGASAGR
jgi:hypothetical protein